MKVMKESGYKELISKPEVSFWVPLLIPLLGLAIAWGVLTTRVDANEAKLAKYPSEDYFNLKFQTIERDMSNLGVLLREHISETK
jgi:hypothetical protein